MNGPGLADQIDGLYRRAVLEPGAVDEPMLVEWSEAAFEAAGGDRAAARAIRKSIRTSRKLAAYWSDRDAGALPDWRNGVDEALGGLGWSAQLEVLMGALEASPDAHLFDLVKQRYRQVHFAEWMEQVTYEDWLESR